MDVFATLMGVLSWTWYYLVPFLVVIGVLVFIHEFGHFFFAKLFGIRVDVFSFGVGPRLIGFRRKETDYRISAVPWGGYVKIAGETLEDATGAMDELQSKPIYARFIIFFAVNLFHRRSILFSMLCHAISLVVQAGASPAFSAFRSHPSHRFYSTTSKPMLRAVPSI